jgi:glycosyltransferase involved in cell wall biosynthesis
VTVVSRNLARASAHGRWYPTRGAAGAACGRLKVMLVTDHLGHANGVIHGASRYYLQVLPRIDRERFDVQLCILRGRHPFAEELEQVGVRPVFLRRGKWDVRALTDLDRLVQRHQVDVLHCLAMKGCLFGRLVGRLRGIPALIHLHDTNDPGAAIGLLQRQVAPWTARTLAVSEVVRRYAIKQLGVSPENTEVLHNGLDVEQFARVDPSDRRRLRNDLRIDADADVVLLAGRVVRGKGQRELIAAWPHVVKRHPRAILVVAGDGTDLAACREAARAAGIHAAVRFTGQRRDIPQLLAACDVAVVPSLVEEGFGYAALEAAAAGRPVVAFDTGALREIVVGGQTGVLVPAGDIPQFVECVLGLLQDESRRGELGGRAAIHARRFGIEAHVQRLQEIYLEVARAPALESR